MDEVYHQNIKKGIVKMINILLFLMFLVTRCHTQGVDEMQITDKETLELERELKLINKFPIHSIQTKFEYIVDCIDIKKQPAFDHPLLKNHKLQKKPSFWHTKANASMKGSLSKQEIRFEKVLCPIGTVPIRRTTREDLIRAKSLLNIGILAEDGPDTHVAEVIPTNEQIFYGVKGTASVWNPKVNKDQTSSIHSWVQKGEGDGINKIITGWHVSPQLYGDDGTHIFSRWTSDNFKNTGCYNVQCPGFVQIDNTIHIGARVAETSVYGGNMTEMPIYLSQDPNTKNWWLNIASKDVGYFPAALFSNLDSADEVGWGGKTSTTMGTSSPPMGSGYFPDDNYVHACYFIHIAFQNDTSRKNDYSPQVYQAKQFTDKENCYGVAYYGDQLGQAGYAMQLGGPGGACD